MPTPAPTAPTVPSASTTEPADRTDRTTDQRLEALETQAAFADDLLDELNLRVYRQQQQIDRLQAEVVRLREQQPEPGQGGAAARDERPPHY